MRLLQLRYFIAVAENQNISQTAKKLHISQPALSRSIKELEQELDVELFSRNKHSLELTPQGKSFQHNVVQALDLLENAITSAKRLNDLTAQSITLRVQRTSPLIPEIIHHIQQAVPEIDVQLAQHGLESDWLDRYDFEFSTYPIKGNKNILLVDEEILVATSIKSTLSNLSTIGLEQLKKSKIIMTNPTPLRDIIEDYFKKYKYRINPEFVTSDLNTLFGLISENIGVGLVPEKSWNTIINQPIHLAHLGPDILKRQIYLSYLPSLEGRKYHKNVKEAILNYFESLDKK
ncbi:LysR family transcriptional regulator [Liquorilactobacillus cacaonum]|uniref:LysR family transcriptional regulator n=1 Tax=Liquorilactobacillus cacaonum DSM 21116 TaxID=1423729 RepID=A0A0R2CEZ3_9LACO|nr:LysR family transcriptional regulator [Liquorilactobacillus cacaonum]KRM89898.1 LysR family transcriptional regulator [Liquorilactobacillus cacaonum DSM 21116]